MELFSIFSRKNAPIQVPYVTDVHSHVLPGVDDGSQDVESSIYLLRNMQKWGIRHVIATPHVAEGFPNDDVTLDAALDQLQKELAKTDLTVTVSRSSENRIDDFFRQQLQSGLIKTYPNNYILVENSFLQEPWQLDRFLFDLKVKGYNPIMAHPERFYYYRLSPERYDQLHRGGNLFQVNLLSLAGGYGKDEKKVAERLIEKGYVDFLGTDLHSERHVEIIDAYLRSKDARRHFQMLSGKLLNDRVFK